jgi:D-alanine-D-alanine ligase-like ATP-grasp enzyme
MSTSSKVSMKLKRLLCRLSKSMDRARGKGQNPNMADFIGIYRKIWEDAAGRISGDFIEIQEGLWKISCGGRTTFVNNYKVQIDDPVVLSMAGNKPLCYRMLGEAGIRVPPHETFRFPDCERPIRFMQQFDGEYYVVKPASGTAGSYGVTTHIATPGECRKAIALAAVFSEDLLIEKLVPGESYRILVLNGEVIHASRRRGVRVTGDGCATARELLVRACGGKGIRSSRRGAGWEEDRDARATLSAQGLGLESVLEKGREVLAKSVRSRNEIREEICTFYDENVTGIIGNGLRETAVRAAGILNVRFAGIDFLTVDPSASPGTDAGAVNEVNTTPGLHNHYGLDNDGDAFPAVDVLRFLLGIPKNANPSPTPGQAGIRTEFHPTRGTP